MYRTYLPSKKLFNLTIPSRGPLLRRRAYLWQGAITFDLYFRFLLHIQKYGGRWRHGSSWQRGGALGSYQVPARDILRQKGATVLASRVADPVLFRRIRKISTGSDSVSYHGCVKSYKQVHILLLEPRFLIAGSRQKWTRSLHPDIF